MLYGQIVNTQHYPHTNASTAQDTNENQGTDGSESGLVFAQSPYNMTAQMARKRSEQ